MSAKLLLDAGLLIALFNRRDKYHGIARDYFARTTAFYFTTWPVITEAGHFLGADSRAALVGMVADGVINIQEITDSAPRMVQLLKRYADQGPDIADISLIVAAEQSAISDIVTVDKADFSVYRINGRRAFNLVFPI